MTCEEAFKRLYDTLNSKNMNLSVAEMESNYKLCRLTCEYCQFNEELLKVIRDGFFKPKAPPNLKDRIRCGLELSE